MGRERRDIELVRGRGEGVGGLGRERRDIELVRGRGEGVGGLGRERRDIELREAGERGWVEREGV